MASRRRQICRPTWNAIHCKSIWQALAYPDSRAGWSILLLFRQQRLFPHRAELSAAVVSWGDEGLLCINDLHPAADSFRQSSFRAVFGESCIDPPKAEAAGEAYIAPADVPRGDVGAMLKAVAMKYNVTRLIDFSPKLHIAEAAVGEGGKWPPNG